MVYVAFRRKTEENYASKQMQWVFLENKKKDGTSVRTFFVLELRVFSFQLDIRPAQCNLARGTRFNSYHYHLYHFQGGGWICCRFSHAVRRSEKVISIVTLLLLTLVVSPRIRRGRLRTLPAWPFSFRSLGDRVYKQWINADDKNTFPTYFNLTFFTSEACRTAND